MKGNKMSPTPKRKPLHPHAPSELYTGPDDVQWLKDTALKGYEGVYPDFESFQIVGNEDCPLQIFLFKHDYPDYDEEPIAVFELFTGPDNLGTYERID